MNKRIVRIKLLLMLLMLVLSSRAMGQNYEPYVDAADVNPKPLVYPNGKATLCFNVGNAGDDALVPPGSLPAQRLRLVLTMSRIVPDGNPLLAVSGTYLSYFDYSYDATLNTYSFIQKVGLTIPGVSGGNICIKGVVSSPSIRTNKQNGFNVNLQPPNYTNGIQTTDNDATRIFTFTVNILAMNDVNTTNVNTAVSGNVGTNDTKPTVEVPDGPTSSTFTLIGNTLHGNTVLNPTTGGYTYTPNNGYTGKDSVQYTICTKVYPTGQGGAGTNATDVCDTAWLVINILPLPTSLNNPPVATPDNRVTMMDSSVKICVKDNDYDVDASQTIGLCGALVTQPTNGVATIGLDGCITYKPNAGFIGIDVFKYCICDNGTPSKCDTTTVTVEVLPPVSGNRPPIAIDDTKQTPKGVTLNSTAAPGDYDPDGHPITFVKLTNPSNGSVTMNSNGTFTYIPNGSYVGPDQFIYQICDNQTPSLCDTATVYIIITEPVPLGCSIGSFTATAGACVPATNKYSLTGSVTFSNGPTTGSLIVKVGNDSVVYAMPQTSPKSYTIPNLPSDGAIHTVTAYFSADAACTKDTSYSSPASCAITCTVPSITGVIQDTSSCWKGLAQSDGKITFTLTNGDKGEKSTGGTYIGGVYGALSNVSSVSGQIKFTGLSGGTQYTFRIWNGDNTCYKDTTITTVSRTCLPCPNADTLCNGDTLMIMAQGGLTGIVWYKDGVAISGVIGSMYNATVAGEYWYEGKNSQGCIVRPWCPWVLVYKECSPCGSPQCGTATTLIKKKKK